MINLSFLPNFLVSRNLQFSLFYLNFIKRNGSFLIHRVYYSDIYKENACSQVFHNYILYTYHCKLIFSYGFVQNWWLINSCLWCLTVSFPIDSMTFLVSNTWLYRLLIFAPLLSLQCNLYLFFLAFWQTFPMWLSLTFIYLAKKNVITFLIIILECVSNCVMCVFNSR